MGILSEWFSMLIKGGAFEMIATQTTIFAELLRRDYLNRFNNNYDCIDAACILYAWKYIRIGSISPAVIKGHLNQSGASCDLDGFSIMHVGVPFSDSDPDSFRYKAQLLCSIMQLEALLLRIDNPAGVSSEAIVQKIVHMKPTIWKYIIKVLIDFKHGLKPHDNFKQLVDNFMHSNEFENQRLFLKIKP